MRVLPALGRRRRKGRVERASAPLGVFSLVFSLKSLPSLLAFFPKLLGQHSLVWPQHGVDLVVQRRLQRLVLDPPIGAPLAELLAYLIHQLTYLARLRLAKPKLRPLTTHIGLDRVEDGAREGLILDHSLRGHRLDFFVELIEELAYLDDLLVIEFDSSSHVGDITLAKLG
jgi:hypothetical protein